MFVRWQWWGQRRRNSVRQYRSKTPADAYAVLIESVRVDGKARQRHVAYLGGYHRDHDVHYRSWWWHRMTATLDRLGNRIKPADRPRIEAALAKKVRPVTPDEIPAFDLAHQQKMRADYGECRGCYLAWPPGTEGLPPRPHFEAASAWYNTLAAIRGEQ